MQNAAHAFSDNTTKKRKAFLSDIHWLTNKKILTTIQRTSRVLWQSKYTCVFSPITNRLSTVKPLKWRVSLVWRCYILSRLKVRSCKKIRGGTSCHSFPFVYPAGVSSHKLNSRLIVNQLGLGSCPVWDRQHCPVDSSCLRWPWALPHPPSAVGVMRNLTALLSPRWLSWTLHASLTRNLTPSTI